MISQLFSKSRIDYDAANGNFYWRPLLVTSTWQASWNVKYAGKLAGTVLYGSDAGYIGIKIGPTRYKAHRLAFLWMTGEIPDIIDHIDGDRSNNAWNNLRGCTQSDNLCNTARRSNNTTGFKGVSPYRGQYRAVISKAGRWMQIGVFADPLSASQAYHAAASDLHGEFRRPNV